MHRILYIQATSEVGGSDIALYRLIKGLDQTRFSPVVALPKDGPLRTVLEDTGASVFIIPMMQLRSLRNPFYQARYLLKFRGTAIELARLIGAEAISLVHTNSLYSLYGGWASRMAGVPHVWHVREILGDPLRAVFTRAALALSTRVVPMTEAVAAMFGPPPRRRSSKIVVIPDGIDLTEYHPGRVGARIRRELGIGESAPIIGFVARLDPWKGADVFIRAAALVAPTRPDVRFLVCGGSLAGFEDYAASLRTLAASLGLGEQVIFAGWRYRLDDIPEVMACLDVLVHTSVRPEPFGLVLVEAMATGKPVVASDCGGVPEVVIHNATGLLTPPGNPEAVAEAALRLLDSPQEAQRMGMAGRERAEAYFDVRKYVQRIESLYQEVLQGWAAR